MAILIVVGGATAFLALFATGNAARQFSEEQLARAQNTQDLQQRTVQIELLAERMGAAEARALARQTYARILGELDALDQLTARLAVSEDVSVLDLHQSSQLFRNSAHVLAQLRDAAQRPEPAEVSSAGALRRQAERHLIAARDAAVAAGHALLPVRGHATAPDHRAVVRGSHVLVVEDNAINREHILELLRSAGIVVSVACDGQEALDLLDQQRFDTVLMDCLMPVMDGYAATRALRLRPGLQALPVIALTANAMAGDRDKAFAAGMSDHVAKPVNIEELFATLARWVSPAGGGLAGTADTGAA